MTPTLRDRLLDGERTVGTSRLIDSPVVAEAAGLAGMDFVILDQEHGPLTAETALGLCAAAEQGGADRPRSRQRRPGDPAGSRPRRRGRPTSRAPDSV